VEKKKRFDDEESDSDPNALKDEDMVLYEDFVKQKQTTAIEKLPILPGKRVGGEGVETDPEWNKAMVLSKDKEDGKAAKGEKKKKKEKKVVATPEQVPIVFEMKDTRDRPRGRGRDNDNPNFNKRQWTDRGGRGPRAGAGPRIRKFNKRPPNFDEASFPSLTPLTSDNAPEEKQQY